MTEIIDKLLNSKPYDNNEELFLDAIRDEVKFHYKNCNEYQIFCDKKQFDPFKEFKIESVPFLPVSVFKKMELLSVPKNEIIRTIRSSSTTGNLPSIINLDNCRLYSISSL